MFCWPLPSCDSDAPEPTFYEIRDRHAPHVTHDLKVAQHLQCKHAALALALTALRAHVASIGSQSSRHGM